MERLPTLFTKSGWNFEQVHRQGGCALYRRWKDASARSHYEVVLIAENPERVMYGKLIPARESHPGDNAFGKQGWTYPTEDAAMQKFRALPPSR